jgi:hypothetical protein
MMNRVFICLLYFITTTSVFAQLGGKSSFEFLNVPNNARLAALGGVNISLADQDVNLISSNPALISDTLAGFASVNYQFYVADVGQATVAYAHRFKKIGLVAFGVQHLNYGKIKGYDATGAELVDYKSGETALYISKSHQISNFWMGATLKVAFSSLAGYRASSLLVDLGGLFIHPKQDFTIGLTIKNLGFVLSDYAETSSSKLPFDVRVGATIKPEHMPLRFSVTAYNLANAYGDYSDPDNGLEEPGTVSKILRHINLGIELLIHRNVNLMVGYNYLLHQELKLENAGGLSGVSVGFSARIRSFEFVFSRSSYVVGNAGYAFTVSKNIEKIISRR